MELGSILAGGYIQRHGSPKRDKAALFERLDLASTARQLGVPFRRQYPIGNFVADFVALQVKLVVEVDGRCHEQRRASDARRDRKLARVGYRVLRLEAQLVLTQLPVALARVREALAEAG